MNHSTCQVPVKLFALNRERLSSSLKNNPRTPANSVVILEGGDSLSLYDTDVDYVFRQVKSNCNICKFAQFLNKFF